MTQEEIRKVKDALIQKIRGRIRQLNPDATVYLAGMWDATYIIQETEIETEL